MSSATVTLPTLDESTKRVWIAAGDYIATCTAVQPPAEFRGYNRAFRRVDFAIHDDGTIVSAYVNFPKHKVSVKSNYYRYWAIAMGRPAEPGEPLDLGVMEGKTFVVKVRDNVHSEGDKYSVVADVRATGSGLPVHGSTPQSSTAPGYRLTVPGSAFSIQGSITQSLKDSIIQGLQPFNDSSSQTPQGPQGPQGHQGHQGHPAPGRRRVGLPPDVSALVIPTA